MSAPLVSSVLPLEVANPGAVLEANLACAGILLTLVFLTSSVPWAVPVPLLEGASPCFAWLPKFSCGPLLILPLLSVLIPWAVLATPVEAASLAVAGLPSTSGGLFRWFVHVSP